MGDPEKQDYRATLSCPQKRDHRATLSDAEKQEHLATLSEAHRLSEKFRISVDLVDEAQKHLDFLQRVYEVSSSLHQIQVMENAVRRYETIWLPIVAQNRHMLLEPPLDVHWAWHVHMLCPQKYVEDCLQLVGCVPDHRFDADIVGGRDLWSQETKEPYDISYDKVKRCLKFRSSLSCDIIGGSERQKGFYYNVSLPHFRVKRFLTLSVYRYTRFVALKRFASAGSFLVPTYDIDLIWHTHQLCPGKYGENMRDFLGYVMEHDDTTTDRSPGSRLNDATAETERLWNEAYPWDQYRINGVSYRGLDTREKLHKMTDDEEDDIFRCVRDIRIQSLTLSGDLKAKYKVAGTLSLNRLTVPLELKKGLPFSWQGPGGEDLLSFNDNSRQVTGTLVAELWRSDGMLSKKPFQDLHFNVSIYFQNVVGVVRHIQVSRHVLTLSLFGLWVVVITSVWKSGPRLNIKTVLSTYGDFHVKDKTAVRTSYL